MLPTAPAQAVTIFHGSLAACNEFGLVLDARSLAYELVEMGGDWALVTAPAIAAIAPAAIQLISSIASGTHPRPATA